jgi:hypothetical protein
MIRNSKQVWEVGEVVKIGFLSLRGTAKEPKPGDYMPNAYRLVDLKDQKQYRFVPHNDLESLS